MRESDLVAAISRRVAATWPNAWVCKVHGNPYQTRGVPDLLACVEGKFIALEVKHRKAGESVEHARSRASFHQLHQLDLIDKAGGHGAVVVSPDEACAVIEAALSA